MKIRTGLLLLSVLFAVASCNKRKEKRAGTSDTTAVVQEEAHTYTPAYYDYKNTCLLNEISDTVTARFSNDTTEDRFTLYVPAGPITETQTTIRIKAKSGEIVYEHTFVTRELVNGYATEEIKSEEEMERYVIAQARSLLKEGLYSATNPPEYSSLKDAQVAEFENYDVFMKLKETGRMVFHYCLEEETHYYLGYDARQKKVVHLIHCC